MQIFTAVSPSREEVNFQNSRSVTPSSGIHVAGASLVVPCLASLFEFAAPSGNLEVCSEATWTEIVVRQSASI